MDDLQRTIQEYIDYDAWMARADYADKGTLMCLYQIICDVVCVSRLIIRIGQTIYPYLPVRDKFLQISSAHIEYVLECLKKQQRKLEICGRTYYKH